MNVAVLGSSGMLGSMVTDVLSREPGLHVAGTTRREEPLVMLRERLPSVRWRPLDAERASQDDLRAALGDAQWAVNAIGIIKPFIHDDNAAEVERATRVNALFPHMLATEAERTGCRVIQIATDCVWSGRKGCYAEGDPHDCTDVYGKTKSVGEVYSSSMVHLRCSIIGPEPTAGFSLLHWFLKQPNGATVNGYTNHDWNGVTTLHYAKLCLGIMKLASDSTNSALFPHAQHIVPSGTISKADLLKVFAREYRRQDVTVNPGPAKTVIDRTLITKDDTMNRRIWAAAGYPEPPTVPRMVAELAAFDYRLKVLP